MKKLILIVVCFIFTTTIFSQNLRKIVLLTNWTITKDTSITITTSDKYSWSVTARWTELTATDGIVTMQCSYDGINFMDYAGDLHHDMINISDTKGFEDYMSNFNYLRINIESGTNTHGHLWLNATLNNR